MNKPLNTSDWLLLNEPDLTPEQFWLVMIETDLGGVLALRDAVVIADSAEQAFQAMQGSSSGVLTVQNESSMDALIAAAEAESATVVHDILGRAGAHRYVCVFNSKDAPRGVCVKWVLSANEQAAECAWRELGMTQKPVAVFSLSNFVTARDKVRQVRLDRGNGAATDARDFDNFFERSRQLTRERLGDEKCDEALRKFMEKMAALGSTP